MWSIGVFPIVVREGAMSVEGGWGGGVRGWWKNNDSGWGKIELQDSDTVKL